jgi:hypothetical protein
MIEALGWLSTVLVLAGYVLNAQQHDKLAMYVWIIGDIGWIVYDLFIDNLSHMVLSFIIIAINLFGIYKNLKTKKSVFDL